MSRTHDNETLLPEAEARAAVERDYQQALGTVIETDWLYGYSGSDGIDLQCDPPIKVRVVATSAEDRRHQVDDWLDPYWDVTVIDRDDPRVKTLNSCWIYGPSYRVAK